MTAAAAFHSSFAPPVGLGLRYCLRAAPPSRRSPLRSLSASAGAPPAKKRVVFLGTPSVAATTLATLHAASLASESTFSLCGVVTQPPSAIGRKRVLTPSPVHAVAERLGLDPVLYPSTARDKSFLSALSALQPDLCVTAAYGNFLPDNFLSIPAHGTVNIHPSLLPELRGAAPVPRAIEQRLPRTGVTLLLTVRRMDAGPVLSLVPRELDGSERAPELLDELFNTGTNELLRILPQIWAGQMQPEEQDESIATHAPKLTKDEGMLSFVGCAAGEDAKIRAFAGWPGTAADFVLVEKDGTEQELRLKVLDAFVRRDQGGMCVGVHDVRFEADAECLDITCGDGSKLGIRTVQPPGKKAMSARAFWNGLREKKLRRKRLPY